jgi:protein-L-isoaspartate(D-aspartate) O-methyltransferase
MDSAAATQAARTLMVDSQVRPNKVTDTRIVAAMRALPRERFLPPYLAPLAYSDEDVPLGAGRFMLEPMVIARLVQLAAVRAGERALVVAAGTGYGAALLAACGAQVTALEQDATLRALARAALPAEIAVVAGDPGDGCPADTAYDIVLIEGAVEELPDAVAGQVKRDGGRLVMVRAGAGPVGQAVLGSWGGDGFVFQPEFDCATPALPSLRRRPRFVF